MKFPLDATPFVQFSLSQFESWIQAQRPLSIEMTDRQYSWLANLCRKNPISYRDVPIVFSDAPKI